MRVAMVTEFGPPEVIEIQDRDDPAPGPGELAIEVAFADTLWLETRVRAGLGQEYWPQRPPYVPGQAVSGRVAAVGAGVDERWLGRRTVGRTGNGEGGYASVALVTAETAVEVPATVGLDRAASVLHDAVTALALTEVTRQGGTDAVVVVGASGGLGMTSVQLARAGAKVVVATARAPKLDAVAALGPTAVVDSEATDWLEQVRAALPNGLADVVLDNVGGHVGEAALTLLGPGGRFSGHGTPSGRFAQVDRALAERRGITVTGIEAVQLDAGRMAELTGRALALVADGTLDPVIGQVFPLDHAAEAHAAIEARTVVGTTLLRA